jgi:hypothetical protein
MWSKVNGINQIGSAERHPEKAGVGGSSPSLATTLKYLLSISSCLLPRHGRPPKVRPIENRNMNRRSRNGMGAFTTLSAFR